MIRKDTCENGKILLQMINLMAELPCLMFSLPLSIMYRHHQACMMCSNSIFVHHAGLARKTTHHRHHVQIVTVSYATSL